MSASYRCGNQGIITAGLREDLGLYKIDRFRVNDRQTRADSLTMIIGVLDDHFASYSMHVRGLRPDGEMASAFHEECHLAGACRPFRGVAAPPVLRAALLGRYTT